MVSPSFKEGYKERLFSGTGIRSYFHKSRFHWFNRKVAELPHRELTLLEIGCFDGMLLNFCNVDPVRYVGVDANWEGGLAEAKANFCDTPNRDFIEATDASALHTFGRGSFNLAVALETIEHMPDDVAIEYLNEIARVVNGTFLISVPNEKGPIFLVKWLVKKLVYGSAEEYSGLELINATMGRLDRVERREHKGFDYDRLVSQLGKHFVVSSIENIPFRWLPIWASFTVGITAKTK